MKKKVTIALTPEMIAQVRTAVMRTPGLTLATLTALALERMVRGPWSGSAGVAFTRCRADCRWDGRLKMLNELARGQSKIAATQSRRVEP